MAIGRFYTPEDDAKLREILARGATREAAAIALGRTTMSIQARCYKLGLGKYRTKRWTPEDDKVLTALYLAYKHENDITAALGRTYSAVRQRIFDLGLKREARKTRLAYRYGTEILANGKDTALILAELREAEEKQKAEKIAADEASTKALLDEMERGLNAGCDRSFMFTAALVGGATLQAIGDRVGITRERVRQVIEKWARVRRVIKKRAEDQIEGTP